MKNPFLFAGAVNGFLTVAIGAFGAHALRGRIETYHYDVFQTGVQYHSIHALALIALGITLFHIPSKWLTRAGWLFLLGIILFSGSLYLLALTGSRPLGIITPLGGFSFLLAWISFAIGVFHQQVTATNE